MRIAFAAIAIGALLMCSACSISAIEGSGVVTRETRSVSGFDRIALSHTGRVILTQGEHEGITVSADDNLMEYIVTEVRGGTLRIGLTSTASMGRFRPSEPLVFEVSFKDLSALSISGSGSFELGELATPSLDISVSGCGDIEIERVVTDKVRMSISGSGEVTLGGEAQELSISVSGSGDCRTQDLHVRRAEVSVSGSGTVVLSADEELDVRISGSGSVRYLGNPSVTTSISGTGSIKAAAGSASSA